ncbi:MAG TPA: hypothetical protein VJN70_04070 [Gemmatimonadaceae bacterium]|nr:hypothetical protein [Gemmatimonadaceae bacterium]
MPINWKSLIVVAMSLAAATGCAPPPELIITPLGAERTYPATPDNVKIPLYATRQPECPYDEIAAITAEGLQSDEEMLATLKSKARTLGADAIVGYAQGIRASVRVRSGTAIRFRSTDCTK